MTPEAVIKAIDKYRANGEESPKLDSVLYDLAQKIVEDKMLLKKNVGRINAGWKLVLHDSVKYAPMPTDDLNRLLGRLEANKAQFDVLVDWWRAV